jgi:hypothetical protein
MTWAFVIPGSPTVFSSTRPAPWGGSGAAAGGGNEASVRRLG